MNSKTPQSVVDILWNFSFNIISSKVGFLKFGTCIAKIHQERECKGLMSTWQLSLMPGDPASYPVIVPHKVKLYCQDKPEKLLSTLDSWKVPSKDFLRCRCCDLHCQFPLAVQKALGKPQVMLRSRSIFSVAPWTTMYIEWFDVLLTLCLCTTCHKGNQIMPQYSCKKSLQAFLSLCLNLSLCMQMSGVCV